MNSLILFLSTLSLLAVFKAPAKPLWIAALGATEWGHYFVVASLAAALLNWRWARGWNTFSTLACAAAVIYATPLIRAAFVARDLPVELSRVFGSAVPRTQMGAPARSQPLRWTDLIRGVFSPPVQVTSLEYARIRNVPLLLDLYRPLRPAGPLPVVVVVHGGSWQGGTRDELSSLNRYLAARGYAVASVDYRLAPRATFPAQREDVFTALHYLRAKAAELALDTDQIVLLGRSAGGQIAISTAYAQKDPAIKGVIAFYTPSDLVWGYSVPANPLIMNSRKVIETYLGGTPAQIPAVYEASSPPYAVNATTLPTLLIHGGRDELVSPLHNERLSQRLRAAGRPYVYLKLPWATHGCDVNFSGPCGQLSTYAVERFLAAVLKP